MSTCTSRNQLHSLCGRFWMNLLPNHTMEGPNITEDPKFTEKGSWGFMLHFPPTHTSTHTEGSTPVAPCKCSSLMQLLHMPTTYKGQHIKQGSPPRFFVFFSQAKGRKKSKNTMALCPGIRQSKCCLLFPFSSVRVRLIKLMKGGFPEQLQLRVCNPGDAVSQAAMRLLCGPQLSKWVCASPLITSTAPADFLSLWKILQELATFPVLSATDAPHSVVVWCWLHNRQCPKQSCWRPEAMNTLDT